MHARMVAFHLVWSGCGKMNSMTHEPRWSQALRELLQHTRVAALGTLQPDGRPFVSMVPFAIEPERGVLVIHVSALAAHSGNMERNPQVSLLVMQAEVEGEAVHALPRITFEGVASPMERGTQPWEQARATYLQRFPEAQPMTELGDFRFVQITVLAARQVAGFGAARALDEQQLQMLLQATH